MILFEKTYDGESISDLGRDIHESLDPDYNSEMLNVPISDNGCGFHIGSFKVTIEWSSE